MRGVLGTVQCVYCARNQIDSQSCATCNQPNFLNFRVLELKLPISNAMAVHNIQGWFSPQRVISTLDPYSLTHTMLLLYVPCLIRTGDCPEDQGPDQ